MLLLTTGCDDELRQQHLEQNPFHIGDVVVMKGLNVTGVVDYATYPSWCNILVNATNGVPVVELREISNDILEKVPLKAEK